MFKRFSVEEHVSSHSKVKSSTQRGIRSKILEQYPMLEPFSEILLPKKAPMVVAKCQNYINLIIHDNEPLFFNQRDGPYFPTLRVLHKYPNLLPIIQCDKGAIRFILSGANIMCPGLTSAGGDMPTELEAGTSVAILAEGKETVMAMGTLLMSTKEIKEQNKGVAVQLAHFLGDDLWVVRTIE